MAPSKLHSSHACHYKQCTGSSVTTDQQIGLQLRPMPWMIEL